jgi:hypothetical protein
LDDPAENLIRAATDAYSDDDAEFLDACEARWAREFAPDGPTIRELIQLALARATPAAEGEPDDVQA